MKKIIRVSILCLLIATTFMAIPVAAQTLTYDVCIQVQNLSSAEASIVIAYYEQGNTTPVASPSDTIAANSSNTYCPLSAVSSGFNGSVVISSNQEVAAIANVTGGSWSAHNASYGGFSGGATNVSVPLLMKGNYGFNTWFNVQNVGSSTATVYVTYSDGTNNSASIAPNLSHTFDQASETHSQTVFAAAVTSTVPIVVTAMEVGPTMLFGYNGFVQASPDPVMPLVMANNYGYTTGIQIQNAGSASTSVTISYTPSDAGTACTQTQTIAPGASETFALLAWDSADADSDNDCVNGETFIGSAQVTTNSTSQDLVGIVNQHQFSGNKGAAYGTFDPDAATSTVVMPLIMDRNYGYFTGFNIMNVGSSATSVSCTFSGSSVTIPSTSLDPGEALTHVQYNQIADGYTGSATCTATGGDEKIVGVVNELSSAGSNDTFLV
jgi:hypothetical protein